MKRRVHEILEVGQSGDWVSQGVDWLLMLLIVANVAAIITATEPSVYAVAHVHFHYFELVSYGIFAVEYVLRVWCCTSDQNFAHPVKGRLRYILRPLMLADATAVFSYFIILFLPTALDLGALRTLRLLSRLASLARYSAGMQAVVGVAAARRGELMAVVSVVAALLVLASTLMYFAEHSVQPEKFSSIPATFYWSVVTVTTLGYGDVFPVTNIGRLLSGIIALLGVGIFALPAGILGSGFVEQIHRRHAETEHTCPHCGGDLTGNSPI
jgi:voltage-gated potassium channel